jgi:hypothetical protein
MTITKVFQENDFANNLDFDGTGTITVQHDAFIFGIFDNAFEMFGGPWTFKIDGYIQSQNEGIVFYNKNIVAPIKNASVTIGVEGEIHAAGAGLAGIDSEVALDLTNSGLIEGADYGIHMGNGALSSTKAMTITNNAGAEIRGNVYGIDDADTGHTLTVNNKGTIDGIRWYTGATITNSGTTGKLQDNGLSAAKDTVTNSGQINGNVSLDIGDDTIKNTGDIIGQIDFLTGKNSLTNGGAIQGQVLFGDKDDTMVNTGSVGADVGFFDGKNALTNSGTILGLVTMGTGNDVVKNTGSMNGAFLRLGEGNNSVTNGGTIANQLTAGAANDSLTNTKLMTGHIGLGDGNNKITNSGTITSGISLGGGDDVVTNTGHITGMVLLGIGNDTYIGGNFTDSVSDDGGDDVYKLGGGDDSATFIGSGHDLFDGGSGQDTIGTFLAGPVFINLDTKAVTVPALSQTLLASSMVATGGSASIKSFEVVVAGGGADVIVGAAVAEQFNGNGGDDTFVGGGGGDTLSGGTGLDTFVYLKVSDSGNTKATRDTIQDFDNPGATAGDKIDLSAIDAIAASKATNDAFLLIADDTPFTKAAGELRILHEIDTTLVQGDVNGDGKADFTIALVGVLGLTADDFSL